MAALEKSQLDGLFEVNQSDFFALVGLLYSAAMDDPDSGAVKEGNTGFWSFCQIVTQCFLAPPSQRVFCTTDEKGRHVNFFGKAIMDQLGPKVTIQELYGGGSESHPDVKWLVENFARYVGIQFFNNGLKRFDSTAAEASIQQLLDGKRKLKLFTPSTFH
jgi:hypothetical protein